MSTSSSLRGFLDHSKHMLAQALKDGSKITFVTGNQSADLDSMASAILYAYFRTQSPPKDAFTPFYIPLLNIPAEDLTIRPEFSLIFKRIGIDNSQLVTLSDLPKGEKLRAALPPENTRWILVDHNRIERDFEELYSSRVQGVIDHHVDEQAVQEQTAPEPRRIEFNGSCASLVIDELGEGFPESDTSAETKAAIGQLGLASIVIDTKNLKDESKVRPVDKKSAAWCEDLIQKSGTVSNWDRTRFFKDLNAAKKNIEDLPFEGILRKDYKQWTAGGQQLGMSTVVRPLAWLREKASKEYHPARKHGVSSWDQHSQEFIEARGLDVYCIIATSKDEQDNSQRELYAEWTGQKAKEGVERFEEQNKDELQLRPKEIEGMKQDRRRTWQQGNVDKTRKQVGPMMRKALGAEA